MDIYLATEHAYHFIPQFSIDVARDRVEQKKMSLIAGTLGSLFSRSKPEDLQLATVENRVEPFWLLEASSRTVYDRARTYTVPASGAEVKSVTMMGQDLPTVSQPKGEPAFTLTGKPVLTVVAASQTSPMALPSVSACSGFGMPTQLS